MRGAIRNAFRMFHTMESIRPVSPIFKFQILALYSAYKIGQMFTNWNSVWWGALPDTGLWSQEIPESLDDRAKSMRVDFKSASPLSQHGLSVCDEITKFPIHKLKRLSQLDFGNLKRT